MSFRLTNPRRFRVSLILYSIASSSYHQVAFRRNREGLTGLGLQLRWQALLLKQTFALSSVRLPHSPAGGKESGL